MQRRARHWTRWRTKRVAQRWRHQAHLDPIAVDARAAWICSWQRSGSTWLAQLLASAPASRLIYEPANVPGRIYTGERAATEPLAMAPGPELDAIERALTGRIHGTWVDQLATGHVARRRVVKDVRAMGLLDTVAARHPLTPIIVLVRHPLSVARSVVTLGWTELADRPVDDQVLHEVRRWAAVHAAALRAPAAHRAFVVTYEHLALDTDATLDALLGYLGGHHPTWHDLAVDRAQLAVPSATSFRRAMARTPEEWVGTFAETPRAVLDEVAAILDDHGLSRLYGARPEPLVSLDDVRSAVVA